MEGSPLLRRQDAELPCDFARLPLVALGSRVTARFGMRHALAACLCVLVPSSAQRFAVELDSPPDARWDDIAPLYRAPYSAAISSLTADPEKRLVVQLVEAALRASPSLAARIYPGDLMAEFASLGRGLNVSAERVAANALLYDLTAGRRGDGSSARACTGVVAQLANGQVLHGRNLDYGSADQLKPLAILVDFKRGGRVQFTATVFAGMATFNTVQKAGGCASLSPWSLSQNERDQGDVRSNWLRLLSGSAPATFAQIRRVAEDACSFGEAVGMLRALPLPAFSYFVLAGSQRGEGAVLARDREGVADEWRLPKGRDGWWLLETNYDRLGPPAPDDKRRAVAVRFMARYSPANFTLGAMWNLLSDRSANATAGERGVWNNETVYSQVMVQPPPPAMPTLHWQRRGDYPEDPPAPISALSGEVGAAVRPSDVQAVAVM
mmetsp:Transcript_37184/g.92134  ORF Transcript_37184/g.92134 Transcript_37184/m.92134 type:complete len:438 (+) Transcript_37184:1-1314(+)